MKNTRLFKEITRESPNIKKSRENSFYDFELKKRIYYQVVTANKDNVEHWVKKGFTVGMPTKEKAASQVKADADSKASDTQAST